MKLHLLILGISSENQYFSYLSHHWFALCIAYKKCCWFSLQEAFSCWCFKHMHCSFLKLSGQNSGIIKGLTASIFFYSLTRFDLKHVNSRYSQ